MVSVRTCENALKGYHIKQSGSPPWATRPKLAVGGVLSKPSVEAWFGGRWIMGVEGDRLSLRGVLAAPTYVELAILYVLLGVYVVVTTDAVVPFSWHGFVTGSFLIVCVAAVIRGVLLVRALLMRVAKSYWQRWAQFCGTVLVLTVLVGTDLGLTVRLALSEGDLLREVASLQTASTEARDRIARMPPGPVGHFNLRVYCIDNGGKTIWFHTVYGEEVFPPPFSLLGGIVYCEDGPPPVWGETTYSHLYGPWWRWVQDV